MAEAQKNTELRVAAKEAARRYRSTWVELAGVLAEIRRTQAFSDWGHASFDDYVSRELAMKPTEAHQLVSNHAFLEKHDKKALEKLPRAEEAVPDAKVISLLDKAAERGQLTEKDYDSLRYKIWNPDVATSELTKEIAGRFPAPPPAEPTTAQRLRRLASTGRRYYEEVKGARLVPAATKERLEAAVAEIEEIAENHQGARA